MNATEQQSPRSGMGYGLRALGRIAGSGTLDRIGLRSGLEHAVFKGTRGGLRSATRASRTFKAAQNLTRPARPAAGTPSSGLLDLTPDEEQSMLQEALRAFAAEQIRPTASLADSECQVAPELLEQITELGVGALGIPEELGGLALEQPAVTGVLAAEALAHGDMGIAYAALAPAAVAAAIGRWGSAEQQATYLPAFTAAAPPAAALAILEPRALFDPMDLHTGASRDGADWIIDGAKALVARPGDCELFIIAANTQSGPALFLVESGTAGLSIEAEPAMGLRAAATGRLVAEAVRVPGGALIGDGARELYSECVQRARIAWAALATGTAQAVLDHVIPYVNERSAFGEPISNRQAVAFTVSNLAIESEGIRLVTYRAASRADAGASFAREASLARQLCSAHAASIGSDGVQLLGGHGYIKEHPVERWYRDLAAVGVMEGALLV